MTRLQPRERKLVAAGILAAVLAILWLGIIGPLINGFAARAEARRMLLATYVRDQRVLAGVRAWRAQADEQRRSAARFAVLAPTQTLAAEALKERILRTITAQGGAVRAVSDLQPDAAPGTVRVRADLQLTLTQLQESLRRLESEEPYVVVEQLSVAANQAFTTGRLAPMDVRLEVSAAFRPR